ncbi:hypothetical protein [Streptomyces sp. NRRL S-813]|nr:hypothetical protein [Streptomyces sp. NRRL S-813]
MFLIFQGVRDATNRHLTTRAPHGAPVDAAPQQSARPWNSP